MLLRNALTAALLMLACSAAFGAEPQTLTVEELKAKIIALMEAESHGKGELSTAKPIAEPGGEGDAEASQPDGHSGSAAQVVGGERSGRAAVIAPPLEITVWARGCNACERLLSSVIPALRDAGWVEGRHYVIRRVVPGSVAAPSASWRGSVFARGFFGDASAWLGALRTAMGADRVRATAEDRRSGRASRQAWPPAGLHSHRCRACGTIWWHGREAAGNRRAHNCPNCGRVEDRIWRRAR